MISDQVFIYVSFYQVPFVFVNSFLKIHEMFHQRDFWITI